MEKSLGTRYIIRISGITSSSNYYDHLRDFPYVKSISYGLVLTKDPFMARFFKKEATAKKYLDDVIDELKEKSSWLKSSVFEDNPNAKAEVLKVDLDVS